MQKIFMLLLLGCLGSTTYGQKSFIGQTKKEVRAHWAARVSPKHFDDGFWDESGDPYFTVMTRNEGRPDFEATFDKATGKCSSHNIRIKPEEVNAYKTRLKNQGFTFDAPKNRWTKPGVQYVWKIQQYYGGEFVLACEKI